MNSNKYQKLLLIAQQTIDELKNDNISQEEAQQLYLNLIKAYKEQENKDLSHLEEQLLKSLLK